MEPQTWQAQLADSLTSLPALCEYTHNSLLDLESRLPAVQHFPIKVPKVFADRIQKNNLTDPLLLQVLATPDELKITEGFCTDPLQEKDANPLPGLLHKYKGRVLIMLHGTCAIHCRYCFRRNFPYDDNKPGTLGFQKILNYLKTDPSIEEVIFSGGDPLVNSDRLLSSMLSDLNLIPHLKRVRFHTRIPVVLPARITENFIQALNTSQHELIMVIHANSAQEIDHSVHQALLKLKPHMTLLNQAVLLRGINNTPTQQIQLHKTLFQAGVLPYYLHLLDKTQGTAHFEVSEQEARELIKAIQAELPGYLVPRLAREVPMEKSKRLIGI